MKTSRYTEPQILAILRQAEGGMPVAKLCREHGMSNASFYKWQAKYGGIDLPPGRPSFITRVCLVDSRRFRVGQARRARRPRVAQAPGALLPGFCSPARNAA